jgi:hypothetical protein
VSESAFFQVTTLYVAVVGKGVFDSSKPSCSLERLQKTFSTVRKKERIICIPLRDKVAVQGASKKSEEGKVVELKLRVRVFVADGEDAKAVQGYIASHVEQVPSPVVVLFPKLPVAIKYDPTQKPTNDSLVKQAKTRAVHLVRELLMENTDKLSSEILSGHAGHLAPVSHLAESLKRRISVINPETKERGIVYTDAALQAALQAARRTSPALKQGGGRTRRRRRRRWWRWRITTTIRRRRRRRRRAHERG